SCPLTRTLHTSLATPPVSGSTRATSSPHRPSASHPTGHIFAEFRTSLACVARSLNARHLSAAKNHRVAPLLRADREARRIARPQRLEVALWDKPRPGRGPMLDDLSRTTV